MYKDIVWWNGHAGIDYAHIVPWTKQKVFSAQKGIVILARYGGDRWNLIMIRHNDIWHDTIYAHLSKIEVSLWQEVFAGDYIGITGNSGNVTWVHLHFWLRPIKYNIHNGYDWYIDPTPYLVDTLVDKPKDEYNEEYEKAKQKLIKKGIYNWEWPIDDKRLVIMLSRMI